MRNKNVLIIISIIIISLSACDNNNHEPDAYGNFEATSTVISAQTSGQLMEFDINLGDTLAKGYNVGYIDSSLLFMNKMQLLAKRKAVTESIITIDSKINVMETEKENILIEKNRIQNLLKDSAATASQYDNVLGSIKVIDSKIASVITEKNNVINEARVIDAQIKYVDTQMDECFITNPVSGVVIEKYTEQYETFTPGKPLYKIADLSKMLLKAYISGSQLSKIEQGGKVRVKYDTGDNETSEMQGTVIWISSQSEFTPKIIQTKEERVTLVYAIKVEVINNGSIKIGMPGEVYFK